MQPIKLMSSTFYNEDIVKPKLLEFLANTKRWSMDEKCMEFESRFAKWQGRNFAIAFNSGSSANLALIQSLLNMGKIKRGDKVALSAVTWATNVMPIIQLGLLPILVDIELETLNISSRTFKQALYEHGDIKSLFITNLLGFCSDLDMIKKDCNDNNIILLEDNCESLGSIFNGKKLGNFGEASTFSLFVGHHLSTVEGGLVCTDDVDLANMLKMSRAHGWSRSLEEHKKEQLRKNHDMDKFYDQYTFYELGYNLRPTEITGFLGIEQLVYADEIIAKRENNFSIFQKVALKNSSLIHLKTDHIDLVSNFAFPVICKTKEILSKALNIFHENMIEIRPLVGGNMARQPFLRDYTSYATNLVNSDIAHDFGFYFPNNPELKQEELDRIVNCLSII